MIQNGLGPLPFPPSKKGATRPHSRLSSLGLSDRDRNQPLQRSANALGLKIDTDFEFSVIHAGIDFSMILGKNQLAHLNFVTVNDALADSHLVMLTGLLADTFTGFHGENLHTSFHDDFLWP